MASASQAECLTDLQEQIAVTRAQLYSLDKEDKEYAGTKMLLEHGLETLEEKYEAAERGEITSQHDADLEAPEDYYQSALPIIGNQRPQTSDGTTKSTRNGFAGYAGPSPSSFGGHFASDSAVTARHELPTWGFGGTQDMSTPLGSGASPIFEEHSASGSGFQSSLDADFVRPKKRQRESLGLSNDIFGHPSKSMRTTPSTATSSTTTPTSLSSFEFPEDPELLALMGGNPVQDLREMKEEQKAQERALEARRQQERADEAFARQLMEQDTDLSSFDSSSRPGSSAMPTGTSQTFLDSQGHFHRPTTFPLPSPASAKVENSYIAPSLPVKVEDSRRHHNSSIKNEGSFQSGYHDLPSSDFIDLENDELFENQLNSVQGHPSSDLVEIDPSTFNSQRQNHMPAVGNYNAYGNSVSGGSSTWGGHLGQSLASTARSVVNGAYNLLDHQIGSYGSVPIGFGGTPVYASNGQGSSTNVIDLESDNRLPYISQEIFNRYGINAQDPANRDLVASFQDRIDYVANDPTRTSAEIKMLLENIRPDEDLPPENREGTPEAMTYPLMEHQKLGLTWLKSMEEGSNKGGILADEMGLGKTIQALALMVANKSTDRACKTTLIICPVALLKQWDREIQSKLKPTHQLKVYTLHGEKRHADWAKLRTYDVVLTTFGKSYESRD